MFHHIQSEVDIWYRDIPGYWGAYFFRPLATPIIVVNENLPEREQANLIVVLYQESLLRLEQGWTSAGPLEIFYPMSVPIPIYRQWIENNQSPKLAGAGQRPRVMG